MTIAGGSHDWRLTDRNGTKAVDLDSALWQVYPEIAKRAIGVAVQDATDDGNMNVFFLTYDNGTQRWDPPESPVKPRDGFAGTNGSFAFAAHGMAERHEDTVHVVCYDAPNSILKSSSRGYIQRHSTPWETNYDYPLSGGVVAMDAYKVDDGKKAVYLAFCGDPNANEPPEPGVYVMRSDDGGASWPTFVQIEATNAATNVSIACELLQEQFVHLAYEKCVGGVYSVTTCRSNDYGSSWTQNTVRLDAKEPCIATVQDAAQQVLVWTRPSDGDMRISLNKNHGVDHEWTPDVPCFILRPANGFVYSHPSVALTQEGKGIEEMNNQRNALLTAVVHCNRPGAVGDYVVTRCIVFDAGTGEIKYWGSEHWMKSTLMDGSANPSVASKFFPEGFGYDYQAVVVWARQGGLSYGAHTVRAFFAEHVPSKNPPPKLPAATTDGPGRRLRLVSDDPLVYCSHQGANINAGPVTADGLLLPILVGGGEKSAIAVDGDSGVWTAYTQDSLLLCDLNGDTCVTVFTGDSTVIPGQPSISLYPAAGTGGYVANVVFPVYDTVNDESRILYAKLDAENLVLDTIHDAEALSDSCPCVNVIGDSIYVTYQQDGLPASSLLEYDINTWSAPGDWSAPDTVAELGSQPMSALDGEFLHCVWRYVNTGTSEEVIKSAVCYVGSDEQMYQGWQAGPDRSQTDAHRKVNPQYAGNDVVVFQEERQLPNDDFIWDVRAHVWGDTTTLIALDTSAYHPHAVAVETSPTPSTDRMVINLLFTEGIVFEVDSAVYDTGVTRFTVDTLERSSACDGATMPNAANNLVRGLDSDSLFAVYNADCEGAMYAWSADGTDWERECISTDVTGPAIAMDSTGRQWVTMTRRMEDENGWRTQLLARYRQGTNWSCYQFLCDVYDDSAGISAPSVVGASDTVIPCAYALFYFNDWSGEETERSLIVVKFDGDTTAVSALPLATGWVDVPCLATEPADGGDILHLTCVLDGETYYTACEDPVAADDWDPASIVWNSMVNLSNTGQTNCAGSVVGADRNRVAVAWTQWGEIQSDVYGRFRSADSAYDNWEDTLNLSFSSTASCHPVIAFDNDTALVAWEEWQSGWEDGDIYASLDAGAPFVVEDNDHKSSWPSVVLCHDGEGGVIHAIWSEDPGENYYEVGYRQCVLGEGEGGQQSGGGPVIQPLLYACRPNPFSRRTQISYQFPKTGSVTLRVYDASGRVVKTLQNGRQERGNYTVSWDGRDDRGRTVANGVYFYRVDAPGLRDTKKAVLTK